MIGPVGPHPSSITPSLQRIVRLILWSIRFFLGSTPAKALGATVTLFAALIVSGYALWIAVILWFVTGRFGILRGHDRDRVELATSSAAIAALVAICASHGYSAFHLTAVGGFAATGAAGWMRRRAVFSAVRDELARQQILR